MNNNSDYRGFQAEQTLLNCGFSPESIQAITSTRVVTHDGQQRVIRNDQANLFESSTPRTANIIDTPRRTTPTIEEQKNTASVVNTELVEELKAQQNQFSRFKQYADNRIVVLESQMGQVMEKLKEAVEVINTLKSNHDAAGNRAKLAQGTNKDPVKEAIDRNGVAPADVSIEKMFYFGYK